MTLLSRESYFPKSPNSQFIVSNSPDDHCSASAGFDEGSTGMIADRLLCYKRHSSTTEMVKNLSNSWTASIIGHGSPGSIETGDGNKSYTGKSHITLWNESDWIDDLKSWSTSIRSGKDAMGNTHFQYGHFDLISCSTGQGKYGLSLIHKIANIINRQVYANNCILYVSSKGLFLENGGASIFVRPGESITDRYKDFGDPDTSFSLIHKSYFVDTNYISIDNINEINIWTRHESREISFYLPKDDIRLFLSTIFCFAPFCKDGHVAGEITAIAYILYSDRNRVIFNIYSDGVGEIMGTNESYILSNHFRSTLTKIINQ